jgi:hypothetical protein
MTDKMLLHPGDPFPALTEIDVTVIALPVDDDATMQELIARHGLRFPVTAPALPRSPTHRRLRKSTTPLFLKPAGFVARPEPAAGNPNVVEDPRDR